MLEMKCANPKCNKVVYIPIDPRRPAPILSSKGQKDYCSVLCINDAAGPIANVEGEP